VVPPPPQEGPTKYNITPTIPSPPTSRERGVVLIRCLFTLFTAPTHRHDDVFGVVALVTTRPCHRPHAPCRDDDGDEHDEDDQYKARLLSRRRRRSERM
jgi:hypothetical protein